MWPEPLRTPVLLNVLPPQATSAISLSPSARPEPPQGRGNGLTATSLNVLGLKRSSSPPGLVVVDGISDTKRPSAGSQTGCSAPPLAVVSATWPRIEDGDGPWKNGTK